jgi:molybdenum-dependent DNA-binding transcriptional regulator ModE
MSKIKELRTNPDNNLNLVSVLELFSPDGKSKYTDMLLRLMKNTPNLKEHTKEIKTVLKNEFNFITDEQLSKFGDIQLMLLYRFVDSFFNTQDLVNFKKFCDYNERNLIDQNDLSKYKSYEDIVNAVSIADMKVETKDMENQIVKVFEDDEWLLLRPLTYMASKKYGSNTKWCTTQSNNPEYFIKYSSKGVLIYCINKKTGYKVASFCSLDKNDPEFSFWNQKDTRIDSLDSELTDELRKLIQETSKAKNVKTNRYLLSDDQRVKEEKLLGSQAFKNAEVFPALQEEPERRLSDRIGAAIRRENELDEVSVEEETEEFNVTEPDDSIIDRMTWVSSETNSIPETLQHNSSSYHIRNESVESEETERG